MSSNAWTHDSLINPDDGDCGDADGGHEGVSATIMAGGCTAFFESFEHALDFRPSALEDADAETGICHSLSCCSSMQRVAKLVISSAALPRTAISQYSRTGCSVAMG